MMAMRARTRTALLVIDVQREVVANAHNRGPVIEAIGDLVERMRGRDVPVIWVQHADEDLPANTAGWEIVDELRPSHGEHIVHKSFRDSFEQTELDELLTELDVGSLIVTGAQTDYCVRWTLHGAHHRGYDTTLIADAHTTDDPGSSALPGAAQTIAALNQIWGTQSAPGRLARVVEAQEL